jgi:hypothetical protein
VPDDFRRTPLKGSPVGERRRAAQASMVRAASFAGRALCLPQKLGGGSNLRQ